MTDFPYICGEDISAINNKEFIRIETDKAQAIVIALDKSDIPYSARFRDTEMVLTFDGSYREQVESIITKASRAIMKHCSVSCKSTECRTATIGCWARLRN